MYLEYTVQDTLRDLRSLLIDAIPGFEFPRKVLSYHLSAQSIDYPDDGLLFWENIPASHLIYPSTMINENEKHLSSLTAFDETWGQIGELDDSEKFPTGEEQVPIAIDTSYFDADLTDEEINILALLMMRSWLQRQVTSIENIRMKYSGSDFKFTSQANHLAKLMALQTECRRQSHHMQRLYKRRKVDENGQIHSNWSVLREKSALN